MNRSTKHRIILDTDPALSVRPGLDIDDDLAIVFLLASPEVELLGITTTYGNSTRERTYQDAKQLLQRAGREDIPVYKGAGWMSRDINRETEASRFIRETIMARPGELTMVTLGPLTNLAAAIKAAPGLMKQVKELVMMGGSTAGKPELNFGAHPAASAVVLGSEAPKFIVTMELCFQAAFRMKHLRRLLGKPDLVLAPYLPAMRRWLLFNRALVNIISRWQPGLARGGFFPWDGIAVSYLVAPELFSEIQQVEMGMKRNRVVINRVPGSPGSPNLVRLPMRLNAEGFLELFTQRLASLTVR